MFSTPRALPARQSIALAIATSVRPRWRILAAAGHTYPAFIWRKEKGYIPAEPFRILLEVNQAPLENWRAHCKVIRLQSNGSLAAAVQFVRLSKANLKVIERIAHA